MSRGATSACLLLATMIAGSLPREARGQEWSADVSAGQTVFESVSANVGANNLMGSLRYDARRGAWVYGAAAAPLRSQDPFWGAFGTGGRFTLAGSGSGPASAGIELGGHGYLFRDPIADQNGTGGTIDVMPFTRFNAGAARLDLRGGWRGHALSFAGATEHRGIVEAGARLTYGTVLRVGAETRLVRSTEGSYPFAGGSLTYSGLPLSVSIYAGRWVSDELNDVAWGAAAGYALNSRMSLWASVRQEARDPLYWNAARRTWSVGMTRRLGRGTLAAVPTPRTEAGRVAFRVAVADAPGTSELWIAGSFNEWQPVRMEREGGYWTLRVPLAAGVYHYAFRSGTGDWFVPASVAGRRDDGMGGQVAVLVVG